MRKRTMGLVGGAALLAMASGAGAGTNGGVFCEVDYDPANGLFPDQVFPLSTLFDTADPEAPELVGGLLRLSTSADVENLAYLQTARRRAARHDAGELLCMPSDVLEPS